jgi:hypothetical protein
LFSSDPHPWYPAPLVYHYSWLFTRSSHTHTVLQSYYTTVHLNRPHKFLGIFSVWEKKDGKGSNIGKKMMEKVGEIRICEERGVGEKK